MASDRSDLVFRLVGEDEARDLAAWLAGETWPFHSRSRWTVTDALASIQDGDFSGTNPTYWVELAGRRIGIVHYRYLEDVSPDADFRLLSPFRGRGLALAWSNGPLTISSRRPPSTVSRARPGSTMSPCAASSSTAGGSKAHYRSSWPTEDGGWIDNVGYAIVRDS